MNLYVAADTETALISSSTNLTLWEICLFTFLLEFELKIDTSLM